MKFMWLCVVLAVGVPAFAQVSTEEAKHRLEQKEKEREARRAEKVTISRGELEDLRAEVARLKGELAQLESRDNALPEPPATQPKFVLAIEKGITREQLFTFVAQHKDAYQITRDVHDSTGKEELITLWRYTKRRVKTGTGSNGVGSYYTYKEVKEPLHVWELVLQDDQIVDLTDSNAPQEPAPDEIVGGGVRRRR